MTLIGCVWTGFDEKIWVASSWSTSFELWPHRTNLRSRANRTHLSLFVLPFWTKEQLLKYSTLPKDECVGRDEETKSREEQQVDFEERYTYSGGSMRGFMSDVMLAKNDIDLAIPFVTDSANTMALRDNDGLLSKQQFDRIRMVTVEDVRNRNSYTSPADWIGIVTSKYALLRLARIFEPGLFEEVMKTAREINNPHLEGQAFECHFHALIAKQTRIRLDVSEYHNNDLRSSTLPPRIVHACTTKFATAVRSGENDDSSVVELKKWANNPSLMDYWVPATSLFETIDSVAKYTAPTGEHIFLLLQLTKAKSHTFNDKVLGDVAGFFFEKDFPVHYVVVVPDAETRNAFRLSPVIVPNDVIKRLHSVSVACFDRLPLNALELEI